ncbi:response regulator [Ramlibacter rhizophilus]|uniref:Response regulator n=1 Tax=Ramlibacter rhizophilus TaxID=1781167 RepID=A0A4Z0BCS3_9BURK|nr:response regulator [Ramlibacter rhizophilus]TFY96530.1 response regulator [Ramlibacter rhizophilus]
MTQNDSSDASGTLHVLVVDDNHDAADTLAEVLEIMGCRTATAYDGLEGVEKADELRPDAIVLDLGMPRLNGYEACERIRAQPWGRELRLVAVSGWGQQDDRRRSMEAGFDAHLVKPVAPEELLALLQKVRAD